MQCWLLTLLMASQRLSLSLFGKSITALAFPSQMQAASCSNASAAVHALGRGKRHQCHFSDIQLDTQDPGSVLRAVTFMELKWCAFSPSMPSHLSRTSSGKDR